MKTEREICRHLALNATTVIGGLHRQAKEVWKGTQSKRIQELWQQGRKEKWMKKEKVFQLQRY